MVIQVVETCDIDTGEKVVPNGGTRTIVYLSPTTNSLPEAMNDFMNHFDFEYVLTSNDDFEGEALSEDITEVKVIKEYKGDVD